MNDSVKDSVRSRFGGLAARYATSGVHSGGPNLDALLEAASFSGRERVLDVGSGPGHTALACAPHAQQVTALDLSSEMLDAARELARERGIFNLDFELGDVEALPFPDASFDVVTSRFSAHHYPDPGRAVAEVARVLAPGGRLLLVDSISPDHDAQDAFLDALERTRDPSHVRNWRVGEWTDWIRAAGLEPDLCGRWDMPLDFASWVARQNTPPETVAELEKLLADADDSLRRAFAVNQRGDWSLPVALVRGRASS
jgi:SAM-dependent methyltransferase